MERNIWVIHKNKQEIILLQQVINQTGGLRAFCMLTKEMVHRGIEKYTKGDKKIAPSLIVMDYDTVILEHPDIMNDISREDSLLGIPVFFLVSERTNELEEHCYELGAAAVLMKPLNRLGILRMERASYQYEMTKNYEKIMLTQATELKAAREIKHLNEQLAARNDLLYQVFGRYFSDDVVQDILQKPTDALIGGEKRAVTVMMADLRGFTALSGKISPETVTNMLNYYLGIMTEIIMKYRGTVIEFVGDEILAVFGAPAPSACPEDDALMASITMQNSMEEVNRYNKEQGYPVLEMGIALHRGDVVLGNIGSERMMRYNVIGATVNQCSRIESYSVGGQILMSVETIQHMEGIAQVKRFFQLRSKGNSKPIKVATVIGIDGEHSAVLHNRGNDEFVRLQTPVSVIANRVEQKQIIDQDITGVVIAMSRHRVRLRLSEELEEYTDVTIRAMRDGNVGLFSDVYGKVIEVTEDNKKEIVIYITSVTDDYLNFYLDQREDVTHDISG